MGRNKKNLFEWVVIGPFIMPLNAIIGVIHRPLFLVYAVGYAHHVGYDHHS